MFNTGEFNLVRADKPKKREVLYQPKRLRWMKYIVIPALILFMLTMILLNVDFTGTAYAPKTQPMLSTASSIITHNAIVGTSETLFADSTINSQNPAGIALISLQNQSSYLSSVFSIQIGAVTGCSQSDACSLTCYKCEADRLQATLEKQYKICNDRINVVLIQCKFPKDDLTIDIFQGAFEIKSLTIDSCELIFITDKVFDQTTTAYIETLIFLKSDFNTLNEKTFIGLQSVKYFQLNNRKNLINGKSFLQPMAGTMQTVHVQLEGKNTYDPGVWLGTTAFPHIQSVNFSANKFPNTLTKKSFPALANAQSLILSSCNIEVIAEGTFEPLIPALKYLDLSNNKLKTLNGEFLNAIEGHSLILEIFDNPWHCSCDNEKLISAVQKVDMSFNKEPECATPAEYKMVALTKVQLQCGNTMPPTTTTTGMHNTTTTVTNTTVEISPTTTDVSSTVTEVTTKNSTATEMASTEPTTTDVSSMVTEVTTNNSTTTEMASTADLNTTTSKNMTTDFNTSDSTSTPISTTIETDTSPTKDFDSTTTTPTYETTRNTTTVTDTTTSGTATTLDDSELFNPTVIVCRNKAQEEVSHHIVRNYDVRFYVRNESPTTVQVYIGHDMNKYGLVYFNRKNITQMRQADCDENNEQLTRISVVTNKEISGLEWNQSYVFCIVPDFETRISPFNCQSHHFLYIRRVPPWLESDDKLLFYSLASLGVLLTLITGIGCVYYVLLCNPAWICGSTRLLRTNSKTKRVLLLPKDADAGCRLEYSRLQNRTSSHSMSQVNLQQNTNDYVESYHDVSLIRPFPRNVHNSESLLPVQPAPPLPKTAQRHTSIMLCRYPPRHQRGLAPLYEEESNDYYEEIV